MAGSGFTDLIRSHYGLVRLGLLSVWLGIVSVQNSVPATAQEFPKSEQIFAALSACALNVNLSFNANISGSLRTIFSEASARGQFTVDTTTSFLQLFPEPDKLKAYRAYRYCMFSTLKISADSICGKSKPSPLTRTALGRFTTSGASMAGREEILSTMLEGLLRKSRRYSVVVSENNNQAMERIADADKLVAIMMANDSVSCNARADVALIPAAAALGDSVLINVRVIDTLTGQILRVVETHGSLRSPQDLDELMINAWRGIEQGLAPEGWVWRVGVGYCDRLKRLLDDAPTASCRGDETFPLMEDRKTNNDFVDNCQAVWRRNAGEPACMFDCAAGRPRGLRLYKRLDAVSISSARRSPSEQRAFIEKLKNNFGYTDRQLERVNIKPSYPGEDLTDPENVFQSTAKDIHSCLASWTLGNITAGTADGYHADQGAKSVTFAYGTRKLVLELDRWSDGQVQWNFITADIK